jgi:hypothetical protein
MVFGGYALLRTENQAGTALALLAGAVFVLLAIQGTPLQRLGSGEHSAVFATVVKRRATAYVEQARRDGQPPEVTAAIVDFAEEIVSPRPVSIERGPEAYYDEVRTAIRRAGATDVRSLEDAGRHGFDMTATFPSGTVNVDVQLRTRAPLGLYDVMHANSTIDVSDQAYPGGFLLITNGPLSPQVAGYNAGTTPDSTQFEVVTWNGTDDDHALARALIRRARKPGSPRV